MNHKPRMTLYDPKVFRKNVTRFCIFYMHFGESTKLYLYLIIFNIMAFPSHIQFYLVPYTILVSAQNTFNCYQKKRPFISNTLVLSS